MTVKLRLLSVTEGYWRSLAEIIDAVVKAELACIIRSSLGERRVASRTRIRVYAAEQRVANAHLETLV
jgi:hypothetical protein